MSHEVFFILDACFPGDLWSLSRRGHVWLIGSPQNKDAAQAVWDRETGDYSPLQGVTTFDGSKDTAETFYSFLGTIDEHHGEYSAPQPWDTIHVLGIPLDRVARAEITEALGIAAVVLDREAGGFAIRRAAQQADAADRPSFGH
jgi:hypothetical protein